MKRNYVKLEILEVKTKTELKILLEGLNSRFALTEESANRKILSQMKNRDNMKKS